MICQKNLPKVTAIIFSRNVDRYIKRCLNSIFRSHYKNIQVILVDSNSSDNTVEIARKFRLKLILMDKASLPAAYNLGVNEVDGKYVFIVGGDSEVGKNFIHRAIEVMEKETLIGVVAGARDQVVTNNFVTLLYKFRFNRDKLGETTSLGGNYIFNKLYYKRIVGKLDESMVANEEKFISERFKSAGYKVIRIPETSMIHLEDSTSMNTYWRKHIWYAKGKAAMFVNGYKMDLDFLISILLFLSIISIFSIGKFVLVGMLLLLGGYFYKESVKYFTLFNSLKITIVEVISTLLRALLLPFLILVQCLRKL